MFVGETEQVDIFNKRDYFINRTQGFECLMQKVWVKDEINSVYKNNVTKQLLRIIQFFYSTVYTKVQFLKKYYFHLHNDWCI